MKNSKQRSIARLYVACSLCIFRIMVEQLLLFDASINCEDEISLALKREERRRDASAKSRTCPKASLCGARKVLDSIFSGF